MIIAAFATSVWQIWRLNRAYSQYVKLFRYLHAYEDFNRKLGCTLVSMSNPDRGRYTHSRSLLSFRERSDRQLDVAAKMLLGRGIQGRRPSSLKDDVATESKSSADVKEEVYFSVLCSVSHLNFF